MHPARSVAAMVVLAVACAGCGDDAGPSVTPATTGLTPVTSPAAAATEPATTAPGPTSSEATVPATTTTTTSAAIATVPPATGPSSPPTASASLEIEPSVEPEVLYTAAIGSGEGELGLEDCTECDPIRPLAPMLTSDGRLIIVDVENRRWVTVTDGVPETRPLPEGLLPWDALLGPGDVVYVAAFTLTDAGPRDFEVLAFDGDDLSTVLGRWPATSRGLGSLWFDGDEVVLSLERDEAFPLVRAAPATMPTAQSGRPIGVTWPNGTTTTWVLDDPANVEEAVPLDDGTVAVSGGAEVEGEPVRVVWRLYPDGSSSAQHIATRPDSGNGPSISRDGVVSLERDDGGWRVLRFPLPGT